MNDTIHVTRFALLRKHLALMCLGVIVAHAFFIRCSHLLKADHYYIISPDSYLFHWQAKLLMRGDPIRLVSHSGLTYPLAYTARAIGLVSGVTSEEALKVATILVPPALGVMSVIAIYLAVSKMYDRRVGLLSAFAWAIAALPVLMQAAGDVDRDCLSVLLIMIGAFVFYFSSDWHWKIRGFEVGWLLGVSAVLAIEVVVFIEWLWLGVVLLIAVLVAFTAVDILIGFAIRLVPSLMTEDDPLALPMVFIKKAPAIIGAAIRASNWQTLAVVLVLNGLLGAVRPGFTYMYQEAGQLVRGALSGTSTVSELEGMTAGDLLAYGLLTIPLVMGLYITVRNHRRRDLLCLSWFGCLLLGGLFARRLFLYTAPAACILAGLGLAFLFDFGKGKLSRLDLEMAFMEPRQLLRYAKLVVAVLLMVLLFFLSSFSAYRLASDPVLAAHNDWEAALTYLRESTPKEAVVMSWWDYGYWILDVAEREPVVDNGRHDDARDRDIALVYVATDDSEAVRVMQRYGADYLVFSTVEYRILPGITGLGLGDSFGNGSSIPEEMQNSLYARSLSGTELGGGLKRVYPSPEVDKPEVVILRIE